MPVTHKPNSLLRSRVESKKWERDSEADKKPQSDIDKKELEIENPLSSHPKQSTEPSVKIAPLKKMPSAKSMATKTATVKSLTEEDP